MGETMKHKLLKLTMMSVMAISVSGCASISEGECITGSWTDIGYKDGVKGKSRGRLADYAKTCAKYGVSPDRQAYLTSFEQGVTQYCTYERGYERGENGSDFNQVCAARPHSGFAQGYDEGRLVYDIKHEHEKLIEAYEDRREAYEEVMRRLTEDELELDERKRLKKKLSRLEGELVDLRIDVRDYERRYDLARHHF